VNTCLFRDHILAYWLTKTQMSWWAQPQMSYRLQSLLQMRLPWRIDPCFAMRSVVLPSSHCNCNTGCNLDLGGQKTGNRVWSDICNFRVIEASGSGRFQAFSPLRSKVFDQISMLPSNPRVGKKRGASSCAGVNANASSLALSGSEASNALADDRSAPMKRARVESNTKTSS